MTETSFVVVGPFVACDVNLDGNNLCAGTVSPVGILGFADALARRAYGKPAPTSLSAMIVVHRLDIKRGRTRPEQQVGSKDGRRTYDNVDVPERLIGHVEASLVLTGIGRDTARLEDALVGLRFLGGTTSAGGRAPRVVMAESWEHVMRLLRPGFVLRPREDLNPASFGDPVGLRRIADYLGTIEVPVTYSDDLEDETAPTIRRAKSAGWIVPVPVGYRTLEPVATARPRPGARGHDQDIPHVFVEDAVGLAEYVSVSRARRERISFSDLSWTWSVDLDVGRFLVGSRP